MTAAKRCVSAGCITEAQEGEILCPVHIELGKDWTQRFSAGLDVMAAGVPRTAAFDDLRVGQWVALLDKGERNVIVFGGFVGKVKRIVGNDAEVDCPHERQPFQVVARSDCDRGIVTILRDVPPAPPVTVRREDYDALVEAVAGWKGVTPVGNAARALIDHADTGDTP